MKVVSRQWSVVIAILSAMLFGLCFPAQAQQTEKIFGIGFLDSSTASGSAVLLEAFRQELSKLGWVEKKKYHLRVPICRAKK
jgi:hypothetical protein